MTGFWTGCFVIKAALYARVSKSEQQTLPMQMEAMTSYAEKRGWKIVKQVAEIGSRTKERKKREEILQDEVMNLFAEGLSKSEIARRLKIGRTSVIRILNSVSMISE